MASTSDHGDDEDEEADEAQKETNEAVMAAAKGEWAKADEVLRGLLEREQDNYSVRRLDY